MCRSIAPPSPKGEADSIACTSTLTTKAFRSFLSLLQVGKNGRVVLRPTKRTVIEMRLLCPNCDAEYEVDASVIPDNGRDVQCSNCGHAWFQLPPEIEAELEAEEALYEAPAPVPPPAIVPEKLPRRGIDESVLAVLREEADREAAARRGDAPQVIETQTEMGLAPQPNAVARRIARMKGVEAEIAPPPIARPQTRREMLPEIEEINSSLRASSEKRSGDAAAVAATMTAAKKNGGFRSGFVLMLVLAIVLVTVYVMAPRIAQQIPGAAAAMETYVASVDHARLLLDGLMKSAIGWLRGVSGGAV
jgi:predicted Zn finger-like uncharacterized protein